MIEQHLTPFPTDFDLLLDECIRATGVTHYRWLCSSENRNRPPNSSEDYRRWILARGWEVPTISVDYTPVTGGGCGGCP